MNLSLVFSSDVALLYPIPSFFWLTVTKTGSLTVNKLFMNREAEKKCIFLE